MKLNMKSLNNKKQDGFSLIETIITMFISLLITTALCFIFISFYRNITMVNSILDVSKEKIIKDKFIRDYINQIEIPYWNASTENIREKISSLTQHPYFEDSILNIEYILDEMNCKRGITISYMLKNGDVQTTVASCKSFSLVSNEY